MRSGALRKPSIWSAILFAAASASATFAQEFNWIPSGAIDVGDRASEAASLYEAAGDVQTLSLAYPGEPAGQLTGRMVAGPERFAIQPASWRGGPATSPLVISRRCDSAAGPTSLKVTVMDKDLGPWRIEPPAGDRRLYDAFFAIPRAAFANEKGEIPGEVRVTVTADKPTLSHGYRFYAARDWDLLGAELAGDIAAARAKASGPKADYLAGVLAEAMHDWSAALGHYTRSAATDDADLARLARVAVRRSSLRIARAAARAAEKQPSFDLHYRLGLYAGAAGYWQDALEEYRLAVQARPTDPDATYHLAEAMEYNRLPVAEYAPIFERAGLLGESQAVQRGHAPANVEDVLIAIHTEPVEGICGRFSQESMEALQRDWRYVEQQVYGASRGAWKLRTYYRVFGRDCLPWLTDWIFIPPDAAVPVWGTYDYTIGTAEFGASGASGVDCGVNGSGGAEIGPTRGWEVLLHEWNHMFDWTCICGEQVPGYAATHDSDNCGKQPIVNMGCGHRASMYYYINRAQYRRHEASDPIVPAAFLDRWQVGPVVSAPTPPDLAPDALAQWLTDNRYLTAERIQQLKAEWENQRKADQDRAAKAPAVKPTVPPLPEWPRYLVQQWERAKFLDQLAAPDEDQLAAGEAAGGQWKPLDAADNYFDLRKVLPQAPAKCVAYARTFIYSPADQEVRIWFGYNDCAAMWLNGRKIHQGNYYACALWDDRNLPYELAQSGRMMKGWNSLAVKVERGGGDWGFSVHVVDFDNQPVAGLKYTGTMPAGEKVARYTPPPIGPHYKWAEVKDDYMERLPNLSAADLSRITGINGLRLDDHRFFLMLPEGQSAPQGSSYIAKADDQDRRVNNYLNWNLEAVAALRYQKDGAPHDLLLVRPEYYEEYLTLLSEHQPDGAKLPPSPAQRVLGYILIRQCTYPSTGGGWRAVLVLDALLGDYPQDETDLLAVPAAGG